MLNKNITNNVATTIAPKSKSYLAFNFQPTIFNYTNFDENYKEESRILKWRRETANGSVNLIIGSHRSMKKRSTLYRQRQWLNQNTDANLEVYTVDQYADNPSNLSDSLDTTPPLINIPISNNHQPPPSYEAVVAESYYNGDIAATLKQQLKNFNETRKNCCCSKPVQLLPNFFNENYDIIKKCRQCKKQIREELANVNGAGVGDDDDDDENNEYCNCLLQNVAFNSSSQYTTSLAAASSPSPPSSSMTFTNNNKITTANLGNNNDDRKNTSNLLSTISSSPSLHELNYSKDDSSDEKCAHNTTAGSSKNGNYNYTQLSTVGNDYGEYDDDDEDDDDDDDEYDGNGDDVVNIPVRVVDDDNGDDGETDGGNKNENKGKQLKANQTVCALPIRGTIDSTGLPTYEAAANLQHLLIKN